MSARHIGIRCQVALMLLACGCWEEHSNHDTPLASAEPQDAGATASACVEGLAGTAPTVWAGEARAFIELPCSAQRWLDPPRHYTETSTADFRNWRVLLTLSEQGEGIDGTVRFGEGRPPRSPRDVPPELDEGSLRDFWGCTLGWPTVGADYSVLEAERSGDRLRLAIAPTELWAPWCSGPECTEQALSDICAAACSCDHNGCQARMDPTFQFDLVLRECRLEGVAGGVELRLLRVR